ncbi:MAG: hypothetical protein WBG43_08625 [Marinifilaceae bacterium]
MSDIDDKYKDNNPFKMPDNYFEGFADKVMDKIHEDEDLKTNPVNVFKTYFWMAATFIFIFGIGRLIIPMVLDPSEKIQTQASQTIAKFDSSTYNTDIFDEDLDLEVDLTDEQIIEYLAEQDIDDSYLVAELK